MQDFAIAISFLVMRSQRLVLLRLAAAGVAASLMLGGVVAHAGEISAEDVAAAEAEAE